MRHAMPLQSFVVRQLTRVGRPQRESRSAEGYRDPLGTAASAAGPVYEIEARELMLSADEVVGWLESRSLHTTDLILIDGSWMTIAESPPFFELAEPHVRRERRIQTAKGALLILAYAAIFAARLAVSAAHAH